MAPSATQYRARLARALAEYWYGGDGPSHGELEDAFAVAGVSPAPGSKRDRVSEAVRSASDDELPTLVGQLIELLRVRDLPAADAASVERLRGAMRAFGFTLDDNFEVSFRLEPGVDHLPDSPALRDHVAKIQRAVRDGDNAQLLGSTKELLESAAKLVLERTGADSIPSKFPALMAAAFEALHIHPKATPSTGSDLEEPVRKVVGGALQIVLGIDELRNTHGTGHGRSEVVRLSDRHARLAAGAGVTVATLLLDTLDDDGAPWRRRETDSNR
jgi:hypothetical protein